MKTPLSPALISALYEIARIADKLAVTCTTSFADKLADKDMDVTGVLDNLDHVAACVTLAELENAPAMLNGAARAFRQTFPANSLAWEDASRLQTIAYMIELEQTAAAGRLV